MNDEGLIGSMDPREALAWQAFDDVARTLLGNNRSKNYSKIAKNLIAKFQETGANMSIQVHFLFSHLHRYQENTGSVNNEQGKRFHQVIKEIETRYQGRWDEAMMTDYCWSLERDNSAALHFRAAKKRNFLP